MPEMETKPQTNSAISGTQPKTLTVKQAALEILVMILVAVAVPVLVYVDMVILSNEVREWSLTEATQLLLLGASTAFFASGAVRLPHLATYLCVMAFFTLLMFIREIDGLLDSIAHGFWVYPALVCIAAGATVCWRSIGAVTTGFLRHFLTRYGLLVFVGLFVLVFFSRAFGSGFLWRPILADSYVHHIKSAIQEGLELLGYAIFTFGTIGSWKNGFR